MSSTITATKLVIRTVTITTGAEQYSARYYGQEVSPLNADNIVAMYVMGVSSNNFATATRVGSNIRLWTSTPNVTGTVVLVYQF